MSAQRWKAVAETARPQLGLVTTHQAMTAGITPAMLTRAVASGRLSRLHLGVYDLVGSPDSRRKRMLAAQLATGGGCALSHTSAGWLHGLFDVRPQGIEILFRRGFQRDIPGVTIHTSQSFLPEDRTRLGRFVVTTVERTVCDLASVLDERALRLVVFDAWRRGLTTPDRIATCLARMGRVSGARRLKKILSICRPAIQRGRSAWESEAVAVLVENRVPVGEVNYPIRDQTGALVHELDLAYVSLRFAYEIQSKRYHAIGPDRLRDETKRHNLTDWEIKPIPLDLIIQRPQEFAAMVRADLRERRYPGA